MKKILTISLIIGIIFSGSIMAYQLSADEPKIISGYKLYEDRNTKICNTYTPDNKIYDAEITYSNFDEKNKPKSSTKKDIEDSIMTLGDDLAMAKKLYKNTQNNIYKCALLNAQERSINFIMDTLGEKKAGGALSKEYKAKLERLQESRSDNKCLNTNKTNQQLDKHNVLKQTTFELCRYNNYLEYLIEYNSVIANIVEQENNKSESDDDKDSLLTETYNITGIANLEKQKKTEIKAEIEKAYKLHPIAFQAYSEYENNLPIHDLLTLLRNDFIKYRIDLHNNLNPVNQVVYKISNAMKE